jgi:hypothetical protein
LDAEENVFFVYILFEEDVVDLIPLLDNDEIVVSVSQLADIVLELH